jgi:integrase
VWLATGHERETAPRFGQDFWPVRGIELNRDATEAAQRLLLRAKLLGASKPEHHLLPLNSSKGKFGIGTGRRGYDPTRAMKDGGTAWRTLVKKAGLDGFRFHDLRHAAVTHLLEKGTPLAVVESLAGHLSVKMLRHYTHITAVRYERRLML